ncbi:ketopantoate reductase family protein [Hymenobacter psoromatis]|uniref:ketopantoate reductase family protein n=1 Tax=Hymenobacter psoromatis TaxID=1484116 RepID=UPI001CBC4E85|nr:2-dehydropantoate 2-reductase N-terminal domain-containing protein [Hymenobacter psoromatis]
MKILLFGRGVITSQYGWALEQAGHTVEFYVRPGRAAHFGPTLTLDLLDARAKSSGVRVAQPWPIRLREDLPGDHDYELIVLSVPHYQFSEAATFLAPKVGNATVLVFNNFWQEPQQAASALPAGQLAWGFPQAGGSITAKGELVGALFNKVHFGTFGTVPTAREVVVRELFRHSGFTLEEHADFRGWLWLHFAIITGFYAQALAGGAVAQVMTSPTQGKAAVRHIQELLRVVAARGVNMSNNASESFLYRLPPWLASLALRALLKISPPFKAAFAGPIAVAEAKSCCVEVLAEARRLHISVPRLEAAKRVFER